MPTIEQQIIEAGYKELLKKNHPDRAKTETDRAVREEFCKSLAVARDTLTAPATQSAHVSYQPEPTTSKPRTVYQSSPPRPITSREELKEFLLELGAQFLSESLGISNPAQRRRTRRTRQ